MNGGSNRPAERTNPNICDGGGGKAVRRIAAFPPHPLRTPSAPPPHPLRTRFSKEQLKQSGGGVAIITFCNETFRDDSGNPIAINLFKGAHMIAVTLTESGMICINIILAIML